MAAGGRSTVLETEAIHEILWRACCNDWFEYPMGLRLIYFWFPQRFQQQALVGVPIYYVTPGPTSMRKQPLLAPNEKEVPWKKIIKFIAKGYIGPINGKTGSLIKYFAVPKGIINNIVVQDPRLANRFPCWCQQAEWLYVDTIVQPALLDTAHLLWRTSSHVEHCLSK